MSSERFGGAQHRRRAESKLGSTPDLSRNRTSPFWGNSSCTVSAFTRSLVRFHQRHRLPALGHKGYTQRDGPPSQAARILGCRASCVGNGRRTFLLVLVRRE